MKGLKYVAYRKETDSAAAGVKYTVAGQPVLVEGPKGKVERQIPAGIKLENEGRLCASRRARTIRRRRSMA